MLSNPNHIAIIMDGNRRWAKRRGADSLAGHKAGADVLRDVARHVAENGMNICKAGISEFISVVFW